MLAISNRRLQGGQFPTSLFGGREGFGNLGQECSGWFADPLVQIGEMAIGIQQALVGVLPVKVDQEGAKLLQAVDWRLLASNPRLRPSLGEHLSLDEQAAVLKVYALLGAPLLERRLGGQIDNDRNVCAGSPRADKFRVCSLSESELERVDEQRFARAGFAGEHGEARAQA